ncbi:hypothetical protein CDD83_10361 [Cordyceps sp. RAO-2017]|nr:hypothetical protein CDD83_10361 [Cordyceps sp. RAO-2017]
MSGRRRRFGMRDLLRAGRLCGSESCCDDPSRGRGEGKDSRGGREAEVGEEDAGDEGDEEEDEDIEGNSDRSRGLHRPVKAALGPSSSGVEEEEQEQEQAFGELEDGCEPRRAGRAGL